MANFLLPPAILALLKQGQMGPKPNNPFATPHGAPRMEGTPSAAPAPANVPVQAAQGQPQGIPDAERVFKLLTGGMGMQTAPPMDGGRLAAPAPPQQDYDRTGLNRAKAERDAQFQQLIAMLQGQGQQKPMAPPQYQQPVGYRDLLPVGLAGLILHLLGAKGNDLGQGLQGFVQGRQGWAEGVNQQRQQQFQVQQQQDAQKRGIDTQIGKLKYDQAEGDYGDEKDAMKDFLRQRGQMDLEKFQQGEITKRSDAALAEKRKTPMYQQQKALVLQAATNILNNSEVTPQEKRDAFTALYTRGFDSDVMNDPDVQKVLGGVTFNQAVAKLNIERMTEFNKTAGERFRAQIDNLLAGTANKDASTNFINIKAENYPAYLNALMNSGALRDAKSIQAIQDNFDENAVKVWESQNADKLKSLYKMKDDEADAVRKAEEAQAEVKAKIIRGTALLREGKVKGNEAKQVDNYVSVIGPEALKSAVEAVRKAKARQAAADKSIKDIESTHPRLQFSPAQPGGSGTGEVIDPKTGQAFGGGNPFSGQLGVPGRFPSQPAPQTQAPNTLPDVTKDNPNTLPKNNVVPKTGGTKTTKPVPAKNPKGKVIGSASGGQTFKVVEGKKSKGKGK